MYKVKKLSYRHKLVAAVIIVLWVTITVLISSGRTYADTLGSITEYSIPSGSRPYGIVEAPDGNLWFTEEIGKRITKSDKSGSMTSYSTGNSGSPAHITVGPDGLPWFSYSGATKISKVDSSGTISNYTLSSGGPGPNGLTTGPDGNIWVIASDQYNTNKIYRVNSEGDVIQTITPTGGYGQTIIPDHERNVVWFASRILIGSNAGRQIIGKVDMSAQ